MDNYSGEKRSLPENTHKEFQKNSRFIFFSIAIAAAFFLGYIFHVEKKSNGLNKNPKITNSQSSDAAYAPKTDFDSDTFWEVWNYIEENYVDPEKVTGQKLYYGALQGLVGSVEDPYSVFFEPKVSEKFENEISGSFEGIGAEIGIRNNRLTIISPLADSPAEKSGLKGGDIIIAIDGKDTKDLSLGNAVQNIRGERGTKVQLTIYRESEGRERKIDVMRDKVALHSVEWKMVGGVAHLKLKYFNEDTLVDFNSAVHQILLKNPKGFILDLRNNPGGFLRTAIEVASYWVGGEDIIVIEKKRDGSFLAEKSLNKNDILRSIKTVVLVNKGSASGSEIVAGALQDYKYAKLVGETTFGKGSVQDLKKLNDGSSVKLTIAKWLTPTGRVIDAKGIDPDIVIELTEKDWDESKDPQLDKALELLK